MVMSKPLRPTSDVETAGELSHLNEQEGKTEAPGNSEGAIVVDGSQLPASSEIAEAEAESWLGVERLVFVIAGFMLAFIVFITWLISRMPEQPPH